MIYTGQYRQCIFYQFVRPALINHSYLMGSPMQPAWLWWGKAEAHVAFMPCAASDATVLSNARVVSCSLVITYLFLRAYWR